MIVHNFNPILIDLGIIQIKWYSVAYILGIILGWLYANKIIKILNKKKNKPFPLTTYHFEDLIIYLVFGIILGGRLGYALFYNFSYYSKNYLDIFKLWEGGMSFHGGLLGVIISTLIFSKIKKINFFTISDIIACVAPIGIFLGRVANFINGELYGKISTVPWAIIFPKIDNITRHPSQIYEAILEGMVLFIIINYLALKKDLLLKAGFISGLFLISYSLLRIFSEIFREPDKHIGYLFSYFSVGSLLSIITLIVGFFIILSVKKNAEYN